MPRTVASAVQRILLSDYDGTSDLTPYIETASSIVDDLAATAADKGKTLSDAKLELIERWLSAWAYCMVDQPYSHKSTGESSAIFQGKTDMGFKANKYGQAALALDSSGTLGTLDSTSSATATLDVIWCGKNPSQQIPYENRR